MQAIISSILDALVSFITWIGTFFLFLAFGVPPLLLLETAALTVQWYNPKYVIREEQPFFLLTCNMHFCLGGFTLYFTALSPQLSGLSTCCALLGMEFCVLMLWLVVGISMDYVFQNDCILSRFGLIPFKGCVTAAAPAA
jgi:hypothetical protein